MQTLDQLPLSALKGAGAATIARLEKLGVSCVLDLLLHVPLRYEDRSRLTPLGALQAGAPAKVCGQVQLAEITPRGRRSLVCRLGDGTGHVFLRFFHFNARQAEQLAKGVWVSAFGEARQGFYGLEITHPEYQIRAEREEPGAAEAGRLTPVYPLTEGVRQQTLRKLVERALPLLDDPARLPDSLPESLRREFALPELAEALRTLHLPPAGGAEAELARRRLVFEELLAHHLSLALRRERVRRQRAPRLEAPPQLLRDFDARLPFGLTSAQRRVIGEIAADVAQGQPMLRLVQGDVGCGKTVVAAHAALRALGADWQVALMAPTELLAEQHFRSLSAWLEPLGAHLTCLTGRIKGAARRKALEDLAAGRAGIAIGTHALFQDEVRFARMGLAIIDEQHRFGVQQRLMLREKGAGEAGMAPHQLIMTATPIPRTLAMLGYADLDVSVIDELPPGRAPVTTSVLPAARRDEVIARIERWVKRGRQAYWVCTLIEESEALECEAAEKTAARLAEALPSLRVGLVHGRMKSTGKEAVMMEFKAGGLDLLVATTVIEVGVDVPNASLMVIDNAERLGLAQLHQLRGRVGRGPGEAHCLLLYQPPLSNLARERLAILRESGDGFRIAEKDLELRGPGEVLGTRQTGQMQFRVADLARDRDLLDAVQSAGRTLLRDDPARVRPLIARWLGGAVRYAEA